MPKGQVFSIPDATGRLITTTTRNEVPDLYVLNPNDGVVYLKLNGAAALSDYDYKIPSQSFAGLPGPWISIGIYYVDQGGARAPGEISIYEGVTDRRTVIPYFNAIGRAVPVGASSAMDIQQGAQPSNPPGGFTRLWSDVTGKVYRLLTGGVNNEFALKGADGKVPPEDISIVGLDHNQLAGRNDPEAHSQYVKDTGDTMTGTLAITGDFSATNNVIAYSYISGNVSNGDRPALYANGSLGPVAAADYNTGHISIQSPDGNPARIGFHNHGVTGMTLYHAVPSSGGLRIVYSDGNDYALIQDSKPQNMWNKTLVDSNIHWAYEVNTNGLLERYFCFYVLTVPNGGWYLPNSGGRAGHMIIVKSWVSTNVTLYTRYSNVIGTTPGGVASLIMYPGDCYTLMSDGGAGWMVI